MASPSESTAADAVRQVDLPIVAVLDRGAPSLGEAMAAGWMPIWWGDMFADTMHLSAEEFGAYLLLIGTYWQQKAPLPDNDERLARIARLSTDKWEALRPTLASFFELANNQWHHGRIDEELAKADEIRELRASLGRKGGLAKAIAIAKQKPQQKLKQNASQSHPQSHKDIKTEERATCGVPWPEWLDSVSWQAWTAERRERKKPLTRRAVALQFSLLERFRDRQAEIINASIAANWTGLFPPKDVQHETSKRLSAVDRVRAGVEERARLRSVGEGGSGVASIVGDVRPAIPGAVRRQAADGVGEGD